MDGISVAGVFVVGWLIGTFSRSVYHRRQGALKTARDRKAEDRASVRDYLQEMAAAEEANRRPGN